MNRRPTRGRDRASLPKHPYRDSAILNAALAGVLLLLAWLTDGSLLRAVVVGAAFFVVATAWNWWRFRQRLAAAAAADRSGVR